MAVKIRMKRVGAKNTPVFRIVVADGRSPRDGKFIEEIGTYLPLKKGDNFIAGPRPRQYWVSKGAQPSETVASFIKKAGKAAAAAGLIGFRAMQAFLEYVVKGLVQHPEAVTITPVEREGTTVYELRLHPAGRGQGHWPAGHDDQRHPVPVARRQREEGPALLGGNCRRHAGEVELAAAGLRPPGTIRRSRSARYNDEN